MHIVHIQGKHSHAYNLKMNYFMGAGEVALVVKNTGCSSRGPEFDSQHPYGGSQSSLTPGPVGLLHVFGLHRHSDIWYTDIHAIIHTHTYK